MQPGPWGLIFLHAKRSAAQTPSASDETELAPIRPEAWAAWAQAAQPDSPTEQPSDLPGPAPVRPTAGRPGRPTGAPIR